MPPRIFNKVDFPAPFSPIKACTLPGSAENVTRSSARTPGKRLVISFSCRELTIRTKTKDLRSADYTDYGFTTNTTEPLDTRSTAHVFVFKIRTADPENEICVICVI